MIKVLIILVLLFFICILYIRKENFKSNIKLENQIIINKNVFKNLEESEVNDFLINNNELDLTKNNLIVKSCYKDKLKFNGELVGNKCDRNNTPFKIKNKLCMGNFCINDKQMELISGNIDSPQFKKQEKEIYYNHDSLKDVADELCFVNRNKAGMISEETCINKTNLEMLNGIRGINLKGGAIKKTSNSHQNNRNQDLSKDNIIPYYANFFKRGWGLGGAKDYHLFKKQNVCAENDILLSKNKDFNAKKYPKLENVEQENEIFGCKDVDCSNMFKKRMCYNKCNIKKKNIIKEQNNEFYIIKDSELVDPNYSGYFLSNRNNNTKYNIKSSAINKAYRDDKQIQNHYASDNGSCVLNMINDDNDLMLSDTDIAMRKFYCSYAKNGDIKKRKG